MMTPLLRHGAAAVLSGLLLAGCSSKKEEPAETAQPATEQASAEPAAAEPAAAPAPEPAPVPPPEELPVAEDFEEETEKAITEVNYKAELKALAKEINADKQDK